MHQVNKFFKSTQFSGGMKNAKDNKVLRAFGKKLKKLRLKKEMSTREFANTADIAHSQVWVLESGKGDPSLSTLLKIAAALDVSLNELDPSQE